MGLRSPISGRFSGLRGHIRGTQEDFRRALSILHPPRLTFSLELVSRWPCPPPQRRAGQGRSRDLPLGWAAKHSVCKHTARCNPACRASLGSARYPDKHETHPTAAQPHTTLCAGAAADMTQQGATLQNYNNELVKCAHRPPSCSATRIHAQLRPASRLQALRTSGRSVRR